MFGEEGKASGTDTPVAAIYYINQESRNEWNKRMELVGWFVVVVVRVYVLYLVWMVDGGW
jgi:hypothetical protein